MKNIFYLLVAVVLISACNKNELVIQGPIIPEPEVEVQIIDSVQLNLLSLDIPRKSGDFLIYDFTARIPGFIWGCTYLEESADEDMVLFSYNLATKDLKLIAAPIDLGLSNFQRIVAGPDGKLYMHSAGILHNAIAVFDTNIRTWSSIEVAGLIGGFTVDEVNNTLWIAHHEGVSRYQNGELFTFDDTNSNLQRIESGSNNSFFGFQLAVDKGGIVWYANQNELYTFVNEEWSQHPLSPLSDRYIISHVVASESEGVLINVPYESLLLLNKDTEIRNYNSIPALTNPPKSPLSLLDRVTDENILYSHRDGFSFYNSLLDSVIQVDASNSLLPASNSMALKLDRDAEGNIWIGGHNILGTLASEW